MLETVEMESHCERPGGLLPVFFLTDLVVKHRLTKSFLQNTRFFLCCSLGYTDAEWRISTL